jgi:hypothetical protein
MEAQRDIYGPEGAFEMLMEKPVKSIKSPARMKGKRFWIRSDQYANVKRRRAA